MQERDDVKVNLFYNGEKLEFEPSAEVQIETPVECQILKMARYYAKKYNKSVQEVLRDFQDMRNEKQ